MITMTSQRRGLLELLNRTQGANSYSVSNLVYDYGRKADRIVTEREVRAMLRELRSLGWVAETRGKTWVITLDGIKALKAEGK